MMGSSWNYLNLLFMWDERVRIYCTSEILNNYSLLHAKMFILIFFIIWILTNLYVCVWWCAESNESNDALRSKDVSEIKLGDARSII